MLVATYCPFDVELFAAIDAGAGASIAVAAGGVCVLLVALLLVLAVLKVVNS